MDSDGVTSAIIATAFEDTDRMTGEEFYKSHGALIGNGVMKQVFKSFRGLLTHWDCIDKAKKTKQVLEMNGYDGLVICIGACAVAEHNRHFSSTYGYAYNPPLEMHAWVFSLRKKAVFDFSLPGVIEKGLKTGDEIGPCLYKVDPVVMAAPVEFGHHPHLLFKLDSRSAVVYTVKEMYYG